jgi:hypothetical protein
MKKKPSKKFDRVSVDGFPFPKEFEEQIVGEYIHSIQFRTESLWNAEEHLIISGGRMYHQTASQIELIGDFDEPFEFYALVEVKIDEHGEIWDGNGDVASLNVERHSFELNFRDDVIVGLTYLGYDVIEEGKKY